MATLPEWLLAAYLEHGSAIAAGSLGRNRVQRLTGLPERKARQLARHVRQVGPPKLPATVEQSGNGDTLAIKAKSGGQIRTLEELLAASDVDLAQWRVARWRSNVWHQGSKINGRTVVTPLHQVRAELERRIIEADSAPLGAWHIPLPRTDAETAPVALIVPDSQHGFRWSSNHTRLEPLHDRRAWDVVVQMAKRLQPETVVFLGDMLDLAPFSTKYPRPMDLRDTTTPAIRELHWGIAAIRLASPGSRLVYIEGNHEARIRRALTEKLSEASVTVPVGASEPLGSVPSLLALAELGVEYVGPYGSGFWLWDQVQIVHGVKLRLSAHLAEASHHFVMGHIHRLATQTRTVSGPDGRRTITGICPGCLCRTDGAVPGFPGAPDWSQGFGLAWRDGSRVALEVREIANGRTVYDGRIITGEDHSAAIAEAIGYPQIRG